MRRQPSSTTNKTRNLNNSNRNNKQPTSTTTTQQPIIAPNVAVSETSRQHPFFLQGKDEPILSESLPPKVRGQCLGEIFLCLHCIRWNGSNVVGNNYVIHPIWWGSDDRSVTLIPPSDDSNTKEEKSKISVRYPIKTTEEIFRVYLSNSKILSLVIVDSLNQNIIAEASVPVIQISASNAIQKEWFNAKKGNDIVASIQVTVALDYFVQASNSSPQKNVKTLKDVVGASTGNEVSPKEVKREEKPTVHFENDPAEDVKPKVSSQVPRKNSTRTVTIQEPNIIMMNEHHSSSCGNKDPIDDLIQNANLLESEVKKYLSESNVPFFDVHSFNNRDSNEIPFFLRDTLEEDDNFSASISTISPRASFEEEHLSDEEPLEEDEEMNHLPPALGIPQPIPHQPTTQPVIYHHFYQSPPPQPQYPSNNLPTTITTSENKPKSPKEEKYLPAEPKPVSSQENPVFRHVHTHIHVDEKPQIKTRFSIMFHIISAKLTKRIEEKDNCRIKVDFKLPFGKDKGKSSQNIVVTYDEDVRVNTYEVFSFSNQNVFLPKFRDCCMVIEIFDNFNNFLGLNLLNLNIFFEAFSFEKNPHYMFPNKEEPVIGHYGAFSCSNPVSNDVILEMNCVLAFGTEFQVKGFLNYQRAAMTIQNFVRSSLSRSRDKLTTEERGTTEGGKSYKKREAPQEEEDFEEQVHEEPFSHRMDTNQGRSNSSPLTQQQPLTIPKCIPLPVLSCMTVRIHRATGLKEAAIKVGSYNSHLRAASQIGVNPFIEFDNICGGKPVQTPILAKTFCPVWDFEQSFEIFIDESMYHTLNHDEMIFKVFHRIPQSRIVSPNTPTVILLGTISIPLKYLLKSKNGISGWFDVYAPDESIVGTVDISITLDENTVNNIFVKDESSNKVVEGNNNNSHSICRFTVVIEEVNIPTEITSNLVPFYLSEQEQSIPCFIFLSYRLLGENTVIDSRLYKSSTNASKTVLHHTTEFKKVIDSRFKKLIEKEKMTIQIYCSIDNGKPTDEQTIRKRARLVGCVYVDLNRLFEKGNQKTAYISGIYNIINTESENLNNGNVKIKLGCEKINFGEHQLKIRESLVLNGDNFKNSVGIQANTSFSLQSEDDSQLFMEKIEEPEITMDEKALKITDDVLKEQSTSRRRVKVQTTFSPNQSVIEEEELLVSTSPVLIMGTPSKAPLNYLNVTVEEASLPKIKARNPQYSFVKIISPPEVGRGNTEKRDFRTRAVENECNPHWNEYLQLAIYSQIESLSLQVWSKDEYKDYLIGVSTIDLSGLWYGLQKIDGWYHIEDSENSKIVGQVKITISPELSINKISSPQLVFNSVSEVDYKSYLGRSFDRHLHSLIHHNNNNKNQSSLPSLLPPPITSPTIPLTNNSLPLDPIVPKQQTAIKYTDQPTSEDIPASLYSSMNSVNLEMEKEKLKSHLQDLDKLLNK